MASAAGGRMYVVETDRKKEEGIDRIMISENFAAGEGGMV